ncbi:hypothetical protein SNK04_013877 [Fusarium graminearum]
MEDSTALITRHHVEHAQPKDRYLYSENNALPPTHDGYMDIDEAWRRFEVARRSAEFYMDQYFQNLEAGTAQPRAGPNSRSSLAPSLSLEFGSGQVVLQTNYQKLQIQLRLGEGSYVTADIGTEKRLETLSSGT